MHRLLSALFSNTLSASEKINIINKEYDIPVENSIMEEVNVMCNLSQGIEDRALEKGLAEGRTSGMAVAQMNIILNMYHKGLTVEQIALYTDTNIDDVIAIIEGKKSVLV